MVLHVCDLNAIEARVLGWLANCPAILKVFEDGRCPYLSFASMMYNCDYWSIAKVDTNGKHVAKDKNAKEKRQVAKPAVLGAGYGLGPGVKKHKDGTYEVILKQDAYGNIIKTGLLGYAETMGVDLTPEQAYLAWEVFRKSYPEVVQLWWDSERAALKVLEEGGTIQVGHVSFSREEIKDVPVLRVALPSGRSLHYMKARIQEDEERRKPVVIYDGIGHGIGKIASGWGATKLYGGKYVENFDQAISRDVFLHGLTMADSMGAKIVLHSHDEAVVESNGDDPFGFDLADLQHCMSTTPEWALGLPLHAEGYSGRIYRKG